VSDIEIGLENNNDDNDDDDDENRRGFVSTNNNNVPVELRRNTEKALIKELPPRKINPVINVMKYPPFTVSFIFVCAVSGKQQLLYPMLS
jgi:hypothetical protein